MISLWYLHWGCPTRFHPNPLGSDRLIWSDPHREVRVKENFIRVVTLNIDTGKEKRLTECKEFLSKSLVIKRKTIHVFGGYDSVYRKLCSRTHSRISFLGKILVENTHHLSFPTITTIIIYHNPSSSHQSNKPIWWFRWRVISSEHLVVRTKSVSKEGVKFIISTRISESSQCK